jgi:hypothetical protein
METKPSLVRIEIVVLVSKYSYLRMEIDGIWVKRIITDSEPCEKLRTPGN